MDNLNFLEISNNELFDIDAGGWLGNVLLLTGSVVSTFATGPVGLGVSIACAVLGFCDSQGW